MHCPIPGIVQEQERCFCQHLWHCDRHVIPGISDKISIIPVIGQFILHIKHNQYTTGNPDGETRYIDGRIGFFSCQVAPGNFKIVF